MSGNRSAAAPDCKTCLYAQECEKAQAGRFCTRWRSKEPPERKAEDDPNRAWYAGEPSPW